MWIGPGRSLSRNFAKTSLVGSMWPLPFYRNFRRVSSTVRLSSYGMIPEKWPRFSDRIMPYALMAH
jgi:hypothetical protein